jgi:tetratricopeptide (TPR) repeat protein
MKKSDSFEGNESAAKLACAAESSAQHRDWKMADGLFCQAISLDTSAASRIAYGVCLSNQERYFEAITVLTPILDGVDRYAIGIVSHNLAAIYRELGDIELARRFQWRATLLQEDSGPDDLLGMANDAYLGERHQVAESLLLSAIDLQDDHAEQTMDGDFIATKGLIQSVRDSVQVGLLTIYAAYQQHQVEADFRRMGTDQLNMSVLFGELKRYRAERACLRRAISCFERASAPFSLNRARQMLERLERMQIVRSFNAGRN